MAAYSRPPTATPADNSGAASFAQVLCNNSTQPIDDHEVILPAKKGDYFAVSIGDELYQKQVSRCSTSLIGLLLLSKGDKPWTTGDLRQRLQELWNPNLP